METWPTSRLKSCLEGLPQAGRAEGEAKFQQKFMLCPVDKI